MWTNITPPSANWGGMAGGLSDDPSNPLRVVVSTLDWYAPDRVLRTTNGGTGWGVIAQPPVSWNAAGSTYDVNGAQYWLSGGTRIGTNATNWVEALAINPFNSNHAMYSTGSGIWSSTNINGATGSSGQGVIWRFHDQGLEETVPLHLVPAVKGAFLGAIGDLGGMRNTNLDVYSSSSRYTNPTHSNVNALDFAETNTNFVVRVDNSGSVASDTAYSLNNGVSWTPCSQAASRYTTAKQMRSVAVSADGARFVVSPNAGRGNPAFTTNRCSTWTTSTVVTLGRAARCRSRHGKPLLRHERQHTLREHQRAAPAFLQRARSPAPALRALYSAKRTRCGSPRTVARFTASRDRPRCAPRSRR